MASDARLTELEVRRAETLRMESVSTRLEDETARLIRETADERGVSVAEVLRERIEQGMAYEDLERELEQTEARVEDLRRQLQQTNSRERDVDEIVTYVEEERRLQQRREERRDAPVWTRAKWWLFGRSTDDADA